MELHQVEIWWGTEAAVERKKLTALFGHETTVVSLENLEV